MTCASGSAVEHLLAKEGVAGSIPVSRSWNKEREHPMDVPFLCFEAHPCLEGFDVSASRPSVQAEVI